MLPSPTTQLGLALKMAPSLSHDTSSSSRHSQVPKRLRIPEYFYDSELKVAGILELSCAKPSDLNNPIHPIFYYRNFHQLSLPTYETLMPALRLASLLVTEVHCLEWWVFILNGHCLPIPDIQKRRSVLISIKPITTHHLSATKDRLLELSDCIDFQFTAQDSVYGMQIRSRAGRSFQVIKFSNKFQEFIEDGGFTNSSVSQQLRFLFFFALNMVHELSHAVFDTRTDSVLSDEPYTDHDVESGLLYREIGDSWERFIFGCKIQPLVGKDSYPEECRYGLHRFTPSAHYEDIAFGAVPMGYICALMSKSRWKAVRKKGICMLKCPEARIHARDIIVKRGGEEEGRSSKRVCLLPPTTEL